jgi:hypothetical protein
MLLPPPLLPPPLLPPINNSRGTPWNSLPSLPVNWNSILVKV